MISNFSPMASRLAEIDARGLSWLDRRSRISALRRALSVSLPMLPVMPVVGLGLSWFVPVRLEMVAAGALVVSGLGFAGAYVAARRGHHEGVRAGLALHDLRLGLKDRLRTADEFLAHDQVTGFHGAAIAEAGPWIERAQATLLPLEGGGDPLAPRRLAWVAAAVALVAATSLQQHLHRPAADSVPARAIIGAVAAMPGLDAIVREDAAGDRPAGMVSGGDTGSSPTGGGGDRQSGMDHTGSLKAGVGRNSRSLGAGDAGQRSGGAGGGDGRGPSPGRGQAMNDQRGGGEAARGNPSPSQDAGGTKASDRSNAEGAGRPDGAETRQAGASAPAPNAPGSQSSAGAMPPGQPQQSQSGSGRGQQKQNRSQSGGQNQSQDSGQGQGSGSQGRRDGQDALKSARGALSLMLAVPMQDRLAGVANPGPVTSVTRKGSPRAGASSALAAQNRGRFDGDAGRLEHRPMTPQERRLVRAYFRPAGAGS
ncbi:hypothetical protein NRB_05050 [Novosphingobium sp. 11B]